MIFTQQAVSESVEISKGIVDLVRSKAYQNKTILTSFMGYGAVEEANSILNANNIPTYSTPEQAVKTYLTMYQYQRNVELFYETPEEVLLDAPPRRPIIVILRNAAFEDREVLNEDEAKKILKYYTSQWKNCSCKQR